MDTVKHINNLFSGCFVLANLITQTVKKTIAGLSIQQTEYAVEHKIHVCFLSGFKEFPSLLSTDLQTR